MTGTLSPGVSNSILPLPTEHGDQWKEWESGERAGVRGQPNSPDPVALPRSHELRDTPIDSRGRGSRQSSTRVVPTIGGSA